MHTVRLNIQDDIFEPYYPTIGFEEAQNKVANAVANISKGYGVEANKVFNEILGK